MIEVALKRPVAANLQFSVGDLTSFKHPRQFRAMLRRSVLNDFLIDPDRERVTRQFAELLHPAAFCWLENESTRTARCRQKRVLLL
jgi:hypothetical protein